MRTVIKRMMLGSALAISWVPGSIAHGQAVAPTAEVLARPVFVISFRPGPAWVPDRPFIEQPAFREHFAYVRTLFSQGRVAVAGALGADHGLVLLYANDQAEADAVLAADPTIRAGTFLGEARRLTPAFVSEQPLRASGHQN